MAPSPPAAFLPAAAGPPGPAGSVLGRLLTNPGHLVPAIARAVLSAAIARGPLAGVLAVAAGAAWLAGRQWLRRQQHAALTAGARTITVLPPPLPDPAGAQALWGNMAGLMRPPWARRLHGQPHLGWEYTWTAGAMTITAWVPGTVPPGMAERAIEAAWPGTHAVTTPARAPLPAGPATGGTLALARPEIIPLKTDHAADPLRALAAAGAGLAPGEHAIVQILARPATGARLRRARRQARQLRHGRPPRLSARLLDLLTPGPAPARRAAARADLEAQADLRAALAKSAGPQWDTQIRYAAATTAVPAGQPGPAADLALRQLRGQAHAIASATALYAGRNWLARRRLRHPAAKISTRRFGRGGLLSVAELAALAAIPAGTAVPGLTRAGARSIAPPPSVPAGGPGTRPLGTADTGPARPVAITVPDARHHTRIIGATGAGKTTLILGQILADIRDGRGAVFIDPKGDATDDLLARLPETIGAKTVLFDPASRRPPPCLNVLHGDPGGGDTDVITDNITGIFRRIYAAFWGPRTDDIFRSACLTLLQSVPPGSGQVTLADIPPLLTDEAYRRRVTAAVTDPVLAGFWAWYEQQSAPSRAAATGPLLNKLRAFLLRSFVRQAIAAGPSTFTMSSVLDHGGLLLARLPKGVLGEETSRLLGSCIVAAAWQAASRRAGQPQHARADAGLYIDECHNYLNLPYPLEDMLAEARAYRLSITAAHQNLAQLPADLREGISANARTQIIFGVSPEDARQLERHTQPQLTAHDLSHLGSWQAAARIVTASAQAPAFTLRTQPLPPPIPGRAAAIRAAAARAARPGGPQAGPRPAGGDPRCQPPPAA
jgi:Type IV secretion-system coupling protein DNA-binding domain